MPRWIDLPAALDVWIGMRFLLAGKRGFGSLNNWVSFVGLALSIALLTLVLTVQNGLDRKIQDDILKTIPHAFLLDREGDHPAVDSIRSDPLVKNIARHFRTESVVVSKRQIVPVQLYGSDHRLKFTYDRNIEEGIVIDGGTMKSLQIGLGDNVIVSTPVVRGVNVRLNQSNYRVTDIVGSSEWVLQGLAIVRIQDIVDAGLSDYGEMGWEITLVDPMRAEALRDRYEGILTWQDELGDLLRAVMLEKAVVFTIFTLVVLLAVFNLVSGQAMLVNKKRSEVAILLTMGASDRMLARVFVIHGFVIAIAGIVLGVGTGMLLAIYAEPIVKTMESLTNQDVISTMMLDSIPYEIRITDLIAIAVLSLTLCTIALLRPVAKALRSSPIEALHRVS